MKSNTSRRILSFATVAVAAAMASTPAWATNINVTAGGTTLTFQPSTVSARVGDTITVHNAGGFHNFASDITNAPWSFHCSDTCGPNGNPSGNSWTAMITVTSAFPSIVGFHCDAHQSQGMVGTINITTPVELQSFDVD
ncbi:MAG: plastocyanin/azurin family copper-binding protein [Rhodanobacteraceae bacterium]